MIKRLIIGNDFPTEKQNFIWNMIGSIIYACSSMILIYLTILVIGAKDGGLFAIGLTLAQMYIYIVYYETRNYQVTDTKNEFAFKDYHTVKVINCVIMILISIVYVILKKYSMYKAFIILLICIYRMLDGYADVYESQLHKCGRLDIAGKSMAFRTIFSVAIYFILLILTHDLCVSLIGAIIIGIIGIYIFNIYIFDDFGKIEIHWNKEKILGIWKVCFPLFIGMFLWTYLLSASRIAVDDVLSSEFQSYYQVLFMPVSVINLFAGFLIRPSLVLLANYNSVENRKDFWKKIYKIIFLLIVFTIICMMLAYIIGIPILSFLVNCNLSEYRYLFTFLIFSGGFNAIAYTLYHVLTIYRCKYSIMFGYIVASLVAMFISKPLVKGYALNGAAFSYFLCILILMFLFIICILCKEFLNRRNKR